MAALALPFRFAPPAGGRADLLIVAGERSGDERAARLVRAALAREPGLKICALGGGLLAAAGAQVLFDPTSRAVIGYAGVLRSYWSFFRPLFRETVRWIGEHRPRAVCCVDYGGFNLRLGEALRRDGLSAKGGGKTRTLYYVSPQVWASRAGRRFELARDFEALAVIFPFEPRAYADTDLPVEFVGHPFAAPDYRSPVRFDPSAPVLLLPGSRLQPVARIFPALLAAHRAAGGRPAIVLHPGEPVEGLLRRLTGGAPEIALAPVPEEGGEAVAAAAVLTSSGTMSVHCALAGIPGAIAYRADPLTYALGRWLRVVKVPYLGLANLLLGEAMYPEYIQGAATAEALGAELRKCLGDPARRARTAEQALRLREALGGAPAGDAAAWLLRHL